MLDIARAARRLDDGIGRRIAISGHSQGGHAGLWAASLARLWTPELRLRGIVVFARAPTPPSRRRWWARSRSRAG